MMLFVDLHQFLFQSTYAPSINISPGYDLIEEVIFPYDSVISICLDNTNHLPEAQNASTELLFAFFVNLSLIRENKSSQKLIHFR